MRDATTERTMLLVAGGTLPGAEVIHLRAGWGFWPDPGLAMTTL